MLTYIKLSLAELIIKTVHSYRPFEKCTTFDRRFSDQGQTLKGLESKLGLLFLFH